MHAECVFSYFINKILNYNTSKIRVNCENKLMSCELMI